MRCIYHDLEALLAKCFEIDRGDVTEQGEIKVSAEKLDYEEASRYDLSIEPHPLGPQAENEAVSIA